MTSEQPQPPNHQRAYLIMAIVLGAAFVISLSMSYLQSTRVSAEPDNEPRLNSTFQDTNQTRAELLSIIDNQRTAVYSSYPLEYAFCDSKMDNVASSDRGDVKMEGTKITETVYCYPKDGGKPLSWIIEFDTLTNDLKESQRIFGGGT